MGDPQDVNGTRVVEPPPKCMAALPVQQPELLDRLSDWQSNGLNRSEKLGGGSQS